MFAYSLCVFHRTSYFQNLTSSGIQKTKSTAVESSVADGSSSEIPAELDFFKYAWNSAGKRKHQDHGSERMHDKRRRVDEDDESDHETGLRRKSEKPPVKHKVTSKGNNIPDAVETFEGLRNEYQIPSQLLQNLSKNGYDYPTSIQSHAIPIILKACPSVDQ